MRRRSDAGRLLRGADAGRKANGASCGCDGDCTSGFCVDGVCCATRLHGDLQGLQRPGRGRASAASCRRDGAPRRRARCLASRRLDLRARRDLRRQGGVRASTPPGRSASPDSATGASVDDIDVCDGHGRCRPGPATICAPFNCDSGDATPAGRPARPTPTARAASGASNGSCGPKPPGAVCAADSECASGFCTDGVCCNVACHGACVTCNQAGRRGTCWPVDAGRADPHQHLQGRGRRLAAARPAPATGSAAARSTRAETICVPPSCAGDRLNTAGTCDGLGSCRAPGVQRLRRRTAASDGACVSRCTSDADCVAGHACQNGSCGKKTNGQPCADAERVRRAASASTASAAPRPAPAPARAARCRRRSADARPSPAGADDPRNICIDQGGGLLRHRRQVRRRRRLPQVPAGHRLRAPSTARTTSTRPRRPAARPATASRPTPSPAPPSPATAARASAPAPSTRTARAGNVCNANSCGQKPIGAFCADKPECASGNCAQGVCCATACSGACKSCALSGTMGLCTNVPKDGLDPDRDLRRPGGRHLRDQRQVRGGRLPEVRRRGRLPATPSCPAGGDDAHAGGDLRRRRHLRDARRRCSCFPFALRRRRLQLDLHRRRRLRPARLLQRRLVRPQAARRRLRRPAASAAAASAPRASAAPTACTAAACRARCAGKLGTCSPVPAGATRSGAARARTRAPRPAAPPASATAPASAPSIRPARPAPPAPARDRPRWRPRRATAPACASRATIDCTPYKCDGTTLACNTTCVNPGDCAPTVTCAGSNGGPGICQPN